MKNLVLKSLLAGVLLSAGTTFSVFMFSPGTNDHVDLATGVNKVWN